MGKILISLGALLGYVVVAIIYALLSIVVINSDYWWQKLLGILALIILPIVLMIIGAMITINC